jgi:hypothetical protein
MEKATVLGNQGAYPKKDHRIWGAQLSADELASLLSHPVHEVRLML